MKVIIVGGVAGGASCAARLRRLDEQAEILMVERGPYVSYANCGLPYHVGGVIEHESNLLVANEGVFREQFAIDCRTDPRSWRSRRRADRAAARCRDRRGDHRVLRQARAVAGRGVRPPAPAGHRPARHLRRCAPCPTPRAIREWIERGHQLPRRHGHVLGLPDRAAARRAPSSSAAASSAWRWPRTSSTAASTSPSSRWPTRSWRRSTPSTARLVERLPRAARRPRRARRRRRRLRAGRRRVARRARPGPASRYPADLVILALGVRPDTALAKMAGLEIGERGGIRVDDQMRTSDPDIFAVGDAVEVRDFVTGEWSLIALAGPANRQGRIAADVIAGRDSRFRGTQGTVDRRAVRRAPSPGPAPARRRCSGSATPTTRRSTSTPTRTPATTRARSRSR